ncbi:MAG: metalloregulator ArsR/SmtB family transcription factor [Pseudomonadota bacterium]|nr:metalloregulator ArsR/SmtB family transcription factor [Pseudomonadota bacterium]
MDQTVDPEDFFSALANLTRLRCLLLLQSQGELCVCELTVATGKSQPMISRHLARLRESGIVTGRREGLWIYYRLHPELPDWAREVLGAAASGLAGSERIRDDLSSLSALPNRTGPACCKSPPVRNKGVDRP